MKEKVRRQSSHTYHINLSIVPIVIVFTQYDKLVRTKAMQLRKKGVPKEAAPEQGRIKADESFEGCVESLRMLMMKLGLPLTAHAKVSGVYSSLSYVVPSVGILSSSSWVQRGSISFI